MGAPLVSEGDWWVDLRNWIRRRAGGRNLMEGSEEIRLEALRALTILAIHDDQFRRGVWDDLEGTLTRFGFALNDQEMAQVRSLRDAVVDSLGEDVFGGLTEFYR
jgi:hypothetical protein